MYVYIAKFQKWPGLIKIGFSEEPHFRLRTLEPAHGKGEILTTFYAGYKPKYVELRTHKTFDAYRKKVVGVGGSEFFCASILDNVTEYIRTTHLPLELEPLLVKEQAELKRCMEFSRKLLRKSLGKARKGDGTFNGEKFRISLGVQILVEHGATSDEAFATYASVLNKSYRATRNKLTGGRLRVAITCSDYGPRMERSEHSVKYRLAIQAREAMELQLKTEQRRY